MLLLPILAGLSLVLHGTNSYVVGARHREDGLNKFSDIISRLREYEERLRNEKRKQENPMQSVQVDDDFGEEFDAYSPDREINLAAADVPEFTEDLDTEDSADPVPGLPDEEVPTEPVTTTTKAPNNNPLPPAHQKQEKSSLQAVPKRDLVFAMVVSACSVAGFVGLIMAGVCWYKLHRRVKAASDVDYPAYGVTGPTKERLPSPGDRKLAQSAQMYHYQHQKQQMIAMEKANGEMKQDGSEDESEEENEEGDYTVYECPGLAPTGEMEVRNPLFTEEAQTPVTGQSPAVNGIPDETADSQE